MFMFKLRGISFSAVFLFFPREYIDLTQSYCGRRCSESWTTKAGNHVNGCETELHYWQWVVKAAAEKYTTSNRWMGFLISALRASEFVLFFRPQLQADFFFFCCVHLKGVFLKLQPPYFKGGNPPVRIHDAERLERRVETWKDASNRW